MRASDLAWDLKILVRISDARVRGSAAEEQRESWSSSCRT
jgi:hypothetical protein